MQILQEQKSALLPTSSPSIPHTLFDLQIGNCCHEMDFYKASSNMLQSQESSRTSTSDNIKTVTLWSYLRYIVAMDLKIKLDR